MFLFQFQAHVVAAFEQSLSNMTQRIQSLTCSAEQKVRRKVKYIDWIFFKP